MKILAVDTSTEACSAALLLDGEARERYRIAPREHAALILPMVESLLAEAGLALVQLDALAFGRGPGSFTGVRIGTGVIQGLAFGADLPVVPVSSLAAIAQGAYREKGAERVLAAIDARIQEVYWGAYQCSGAGVMELAGVECVCRPAEVPVPEGNGWFGAGTGWGAYPEELRMRLGGAVSGFEAERFPHAQDVAVLGVEGFGRGLALPAEQALPVYLRDEVAWKKVQ